MIFDQLYLMHNTTYLIHHSKIDNFVTFSKVYVSQAFYLLKTAKKERKLIPVKYGILNTLKTNVKLCKTFEIFKP